MRKSFLLLGFVFTILSSSKTFAQKEIGIIEIPPIQQMRGEESYEFLNENDSAELFLRTLKWIPISRKNGDNLTLGGQYRPRFEYFANIVSKTPF